MNSVHLGERLTQLRAMMAAKSLLPDHWSRTQLAQEAGVSLAALARLEDTGHESAHILAAVLRLYQNRDIHVAWILAPDNADIPLHGFRDSCSAEDESVPQTGRPLIHLRRLLPSLMAALDARPALPIEDLHAQLTHLRQVALDALNYLVPPEQRRRTDADLRAWHKFFPPVPAHSTGWHPGALSIAPYHYVEAGAVIARCGEHVTNLAYDPVLENVPDSDQCGACRSRMDDPLRAPAPPTPESTL